MRKEDFELGKVEVEWDGVEVELIKDPPAFLLASWHCDMLLNYPIYRPRVGHVCVVNQKVVVVAVCDGHAATKPDFWYSRNKPPTKF